MKLRAFNFHHDLGFSLFSVDFFSDIIISEFSIYFLFEGKFSGIKEISLEVTGE